MKDKKANKSDEFGKGRELAVILEKIYTEIKVISEGQAVIKSDFDKRLTRLEALK